MARLEMCLISDFVKIGTLECSNKKVPFREYAYARGKVDRIEMIYGVCINLLQSAGDCVYLRDIN